MRWHCRVETSAVTVHRIEYEITIVSEDEPTKDQILEAWDPSDNNGTEYDVTFQDEEVMKAEAIYAEEEA